MMEAFQNLKAQEAMGCGEKSEEQPEELACGGSESPTPVAVVGAVGSTERTMTTTATPLRVAQAGVNVQRAGGRVPNGQSGRWVLMGTLNSWSFSSPMSLCTCKNTGEGCHPGPGQCRGQADDDFA